MDLKKYSNTQILQMLGLRFKDYRLMASLSQEDLAKATGVSVSTIHKFETGTITNMNLTNLMALLRPIGQVRRPDSGATCKSISDGAGISATKSKEEEQWLGI